MDPLALLLLGGAALLAFGGKKESGTDEDFTEASPGGGVSPPPGGSPLEVTGINRVLHRVNFTVTDSVNGDKDRLHYTLEKPGKEHPPLEKIVGDYRVIARQINRNAEDKWRDDDVMIAVLKNGRVITAKSVNVQRKLVLDVQPGT